MKKKILFLLFCSCQSAVSLALESVSDIVIVVDEQEIAEQYRTETSHGPGKKLTGYPEGTKNAIRYESGSGAHMNPAVARCILDNIERVTSRAAADLVRQACDALGQPGTN